MTKTIALGDVFTMDEINAAAEIIATAENTQITNRVTEEVVRPIIPRINQVTGQGNDARYWAYVLIHALIEYADNIVDDEDGADGKTVH